MENIQEYKKQHNKHGPQIKIADLLTYLFKALSILTLGLVPSPAFIQRQPPSRADGAPFHLIFFTCYMHLWSIHDLTLHCSDFQPFSPSDTHIADDSQVREQETLPTPTPRAPVITLFFLPLTKNSWNIGQTAT